MPSSNTYAPYRPEPLASTPLRISKYQLLEFLGGGMSNVYRAIDTVLGREVAIKILTPQGLADSETRARFMREARIASSLSHENIMQVYDFGEEDGKPYMVMEFLRGRTLRAAIREGLLRDSVSKLRIASQVAMALAYLHRQQHTAESFPTVTHRDIKPENVNIDDSGHVKLMDFGIAKASNLTLTKTGYVLGTPYYMSPEQIVGGTATPAIDIYSFGIMLYEILLGVRPYAGDSVESIFYRIINERLDVEPLAAAGVHPSVCDLVRGCTLKDPAERLEIGSVLAVLQEAIAELESPTMPASSPITRCWLRRIALLALVGLTLPANPLAHQRPRFAAPPAASAARPAKSIILAKPIPLADLLSGLVSDATPALAVSPSRLDAAYVIGSSNGAAPRSIQLTAQDQQIEFSVQSNARWIKLDHETGVTPAKILVTLDPRGLRVGENCGVIEIRPVRAPDRQLTMDACLDVSAREFHLAPPAAARTQPRPDLRPDLPEPPRISALPGIKEIPMGSPSLAPIPPAPAAAQHLAAMGRRHAGEISFSERSITFVENNGHQFQGPLSAVTVECRNDECIVTVPISTSGHRDRLAVSRSVGTQLKEYLDHSK
jgi:serine/threonine protein kinase